MMIMIITVANICRALAPHVLIHIILMRTLWGSALVIPVLQMRILSLSHGHKDLLFHF